MLNGNKETVGTVWLVYTVLFLSNVDSKLICILFLICSLLRNGFFTASGKMSARLISDIPVIDC
jgi:hypothetical protein